jgi:hypothetical protein
MKTLTKKAQTALLTKSGNLHRNYRNAIESSRFAGNKIYTCFWSKSGSHLNLKDYTFYVTNALTLGGYKYKFGNDAPRGGKEGNYIQVGKPAVKFLNYLLTL